MLCTCGGTFQNRKGFKGKSAYNFWGCDRFPACKNSFKDAEYAKLVDAGITEISVTHNKAARQWAKPDHRAYTPKQHVNPNRTAITQYVQLSSEQEAIIAKLSIPGSHMLRVNADAGTGKSTVAAQIAARTPQINNEYVTGIIVSFGKKVADEMIARLPFNWASATVHSVGNNACVAAYGVNPRTPNEYKTKDILRVEYGDPKEIDRKLLYTIVTGLVEMCKAVVFTENTPEQEILDMAAFYSTNVGDSPVEAAMMTRAVLRIGSTRVGIIQYGHDFGDMVYLPVRENLPLARYRYVCVDESQDSSPARMQLTLRMFTESFIIVGDWMQSIFGFTYADTRAMDTFKELMGKTTEDYPLTVNWRCPEDVIKLAGLLCPTIRARADAPKGAIYNITDDDFFKIVKLGDMVLCRVNADLIRAAYTLIKQGIGAVVLGRNIGNNLKNIIERLGHTSDGYLSTIQFLTRLNTWYNAEYELIDAKNLRNKEREYQRLDDDYACILALCGVEVTESNDVAAIGITSIEHVLAKIDMMFGEQTDRGFDPNRVVTLATVHKFKGGQSARIFILNAAEYHPHMMAESEWELEQEKCILHVATTRCGDGTSNQNQALFFVDGLPIMYASLGGNAFLTEYTGEKRI